ncbi:hypothetical protein F4560_001004 [Saccharothrix ecbatanensis]|uniref:Cas3 C-terminal domain-containing protein n=1 Tax=Saccharothrix ecbatanensis TaxID=1105145 RepID=A0A7W9LYX6_9PSEU|nr:hypothetical protein [Saccharothrix ecbatanensis]MBB5801236.1 hypothetical protein [Saccharothrix ecbatanensis]
MIDDEYDDLDTVVEVVLLRADENGSAGRIIPVRGLTSIDLTATGLTATAVRELTDSSTVLSAPDGVPSEVVHVLRAAPVPPLFAGSSWLRHHRPLVLRNGRCPVAGHILNYEPESGVYVDGDL